MKIAVDFDDVILDTVPVVLEMLNERQDQRFHKWILQDITRWDMSFITGFSEETIFETFGKVKLHDVPQVKDAIFNILDFRNDGHFVEVVTSNPRGEDIRQWMDVHQLQDVPLASRPDKPSFLGDFKFDVVIDDNPETLRRCSDLGLRCIRFQRPWNSDMGGWGSDILERSAAGWVGVWNIIQEWVYADNVKDDVIGLTVEEALKAVTETNEDGVITNSRGGKQTDLKARYDLLPALAVRAVAGVLERGAKRYGEGNWHSLSVEEIHNHTLGHAVAFNRSNSIEDLEHTACRALMALEIALREEQHEPKE